MIPTKKPKKVDVKFIQIKTYIAEYKCPSCKVLFRDGTIQKNVTRFYCDCGQELIVETKEKL